jgi:hypothetical protein
MSRRARIGFGHDRVMPLTALDPRVARRLPEAELTYREAGQTAGALLPGYDHLRRSAVIGSGAEVFAGAANALISWQAHLRAGPAASPAWPAALPDRLPRPVKQQRGGAAAVLWRHWGGRL